MLRQANGQTWVEAELIIRTRDGLSRYERGRSLPPLPMALRLGIVLRVPVEFLFGDYHDKLKTEIRDKEARFRSPVSKSPFFINNFRSP